MGPQDLNQPHQPPSPAEIQSWIELCENRAAAARMSGYRLKHFYVGEQRDEIHQLATQFDKLAAFLRDLL